MKRRDFLKFAGAAGISSIVAKKVFAEPNDTNDPNSGIQTEQPIELPKRKLGKTGVELPCLALGVAFNAMDNQLTLRKALDWGLTTWESANFYENGNAELGIGKFLEKNPDVRSKLFIITKASFARNPDEIEKKLQTSLARMKTNYIDLYCGVHGLSDPKLLDDEMKSWVLKAKERKVIKYFGFSTHARMPDCLMAASKLGWIDAVITTYNFRLMQDQKLKDAVQACYDAGVGVLAMKTQGKEVPFQDGDRKLAEHFIKSGFTEGQAKLKLVLDDKRITAATVGRESVKHLRLNVDAALDKKELSGRDKEVLKNYAAETCAGYCAGCSHICGSVAAGIPVNDVMRYLMYYNSFGDKNTARQLFADIPPEVRSNLCTADFSIAESRCPQRLPISRLMKEAVDKLA
jgi:predicted aldo/keto reductase-like oxidoreductase